MSLEKAIEKGLGGKAKEGLSILVGMKLEPWETMAKLFKKACAGLGTNDFLLLTCVVRYQTVIKRVMASHFDLFNKVRQQRTGSFVRKHFWYVPSQHMSLASLFRQSTNAFAANAAESS
jgi:hypothetical protein